MHAKTLLSPLLTLASLAVAGTSAAATAQQLPEVTSMTEWPTTSWSQEVSEADSAAIRWGSDPGEYTFLMVHTTIDKSIAGSILFEGITSALPYMASPLDAQWTKQDPALQALATSKNYSFVGEEPVIPPARIAAHIQAFLAPTETGSNTPASGYAYYHPIGGPIVSTTNYAANHMVAAATGSDERSVWKSSIWQNSYLWGGSFYTLYLAQQSVLQMTQRFGQVNPSHTVDLDAVDAFISAASTKYGFDVFVQPISVKLPTGNQVGPEIRFRRFTRIRRVSLHGNEGPWEALRGPDRWIPYMADATQRVYLAPRGSQMHIEFPTAVSSLTNRKPMRALIQTASGPRILHQTPNPIENGEVVAPEMAAFEVPSDIGPGAIEFRSILAPTVVVAPVGATGGGKARIFRYTPSGN
ncbi:MAG: hypothetical protein AB8H80_14690 [Planctomycetota bacterium]